MEYALQRHSEVPGRAQAVPDHGLGRGRGWGARKWPGDAVSGHRGFSLTCHECPEKRALC